MKMDSIGFNRSKGQENKNANLVNSAIFKLVENIQKKIEAGSAGRDLVELKQLKDQCGSEYPLLSVTACHGFVHLVRSDMIRLSDAVSALVASLFSVKSATGVISALTELLIMEMQSVIATGATYKSPYGSKIPEHPFISSLKRRPHASPDVLNQIATICTHPDAQVREHSQALVRPVLSYIIMENTDLNNDCRLQAFGLIIDHFPHSELLIEALASCLCWKDAMVLEAASAVCSLANRQQQYSDVSPVTLALAALVPKLLRGGNSPQPVLRLMSQLVPRAANTQSTLLVLLADSIAVCPLPYLDHLLTFVLELLARGQCSQDCTWMCVSALIPWLASESSHLWSALKTASTIMDRVSTFTTSASSTAGLITDPAIATVVSADPRLTQAVHIARFSEVSRGDTQATLKWLHSLQSIRSDLVYHYVSALLIGRSDWQVRFAALQVLTDCSATPHSLALLLYQLARERQPDVQLALLRALPVAAENKNNVMGVMSTLEAMRRSNHRHLRMLSLDLYCQLWQSQERCFPQLMDLLCEDLTSHDEPALAFILQAYICNTICTTKAEQHGKEVVSAVSDILNKCGGPKDSVASSIALEALIPLCRHDVVDVYSIWRSLYPRFSRDKRPLVLKSLCDLVSVAATQKSSNCGNETLNQMLTWLWNLVGTNKHTSVAENALLALSKFRLELMALKMVPESCRKGINLPAEMAKTPVDAARRPEDVLNYIPGECWIQIMEHVNTVKASEAVGNWIKAEVATFHSYVYQVDRQEPTSYNHLQQASVVRGVTSSLKHLWRTRAEQDTHCINLCLTALAQTSIKPLPSLSWAFLGDPSDLDNTQLAHNVVRLSAKQAQISLSARKITESYIAKSENDCDKMEFLYSILTPLCRGIPPNILRTFLEKTLHYALKQDKKQLSLLLNSIKLTLREEKIHESNRTVLQQQVKSLWDIMEPQDELLTGYFECASELTVSLIESMTSTSLMWEETSPQLQKAFRFRTFMALLPNTSSPLNWMNEIIEVATTNVAQQTLVLNLLSEVMNKVSGHATVWSWLQEFMGQIHQTAVNSKNGLDFLVTIFVLCVNIVSGYASFAAGSEDLRLLSFPQAITSLVAEHGDANTVLEWLIHVSRMNQFPEEYITQFQLAIRNVSLLVVK